MQKTHYKRESIWQRVYLMYKLVREDARELDIRQNLLSMEGRPQFEVYRWNLLPVIREMGMWNGPLESELDTAYEVARSRGFITESRDST